jgi:monoamine oxidase
MNTAVTNICRDAQSVRLTARAGGHQESVRARRAIVTVPIGVLTAEPGAAGAITFEPLLPQTTRDAIAGIEMGPVVKIVLCFREAFWETLNGGAWRDGSFFSGDGDFPTLWTQLPIRANTLVAWAGGPAADRFAEQGHTERIDAALACAGRYFGDVGAVRDAFVSAYSHDWQRDPFARGAYSYVVVGGERARESLAGSIDGVLWLAGEATAGGGEGGTVSGALESGRRAAHELLREQT